MSEGAPVQEDEPPRAAPKQLAPGAGRRASQLAALALGWLLGTAWQLQQRDLASVQGQWAMAASAMVLLAFIAIVGSRRHPPLAAEASARARRVSTLALSLRLAACVLAAALAAQALTTWRAGARLAERLPAALEGRDIIATGIVSQLPRAGLQGTRFLFDVEEATLNGAAVVLPPTLSLGWYRMAEPDALLLGPDTEVKAGQRWRFTVRLRQPHGALNPGGFDVELWLFERGIGATGSVRSSAGDTAVLLAEAAGAPVERLRQRVRDAIEQRVADAAQAGVLAALSIGDQAAIEREDWDLYRITGVAHLMSISGLHVTMFAWVAGAGIGWLWRRSARAMLWLPAPMAGRWGGVAVALAYSLVAGWGVPAQRTVWMLFTVALLQSLGRRWPLHGVLLAVAVVVVAVDPWAMLQPGFWLSFVAVALLVASEPATPGMGEEVETAPATATRRGLAGWAARVVTRLWAVAGSALRTQAIATIGLAPLTLVFFQQISLVGFAANLVAIPLVTLLIAPLALLGALLPPLWDLDAAFVVLLSRYLQWLAAWPAAVWQAAAAPVWAMVAGLFGGLLAILPLPWRLRALALPLMLPLLWPPLPRPAEGQFELVAADIGQGTAALVRTKSHLLVYDTGPAFSPEADAGSRVLLPLLRWRGEPRIDLLMLSHRDSDHVGGAASLLAGYAVSAVSSSLVDEHTLLVRARARGIPHRRCELGQRWQWDGVDFEVLHPTAADHALAPPPRPNALSCVLRVRGASVNANTSASASVLLTGDIEAPQEAALLARTPPEALHAAILLVPHHGSRTSSTPRFIEAVAPRAAIVQAAYRSRFGHPAPDIVARYESRGILLWRSDRCGAFTLQIDGTERCEREAARRYWHHRVSPADAD